MLHVTYIEPKEAMVRQAVAAQMEMQMARINLQAVYLEQLVKQSAVCAVEWRTGIELTQEESGTDLFIARLNTTKDY
ncbi:hypothetical protein J6590_074005 [Homalodisca vitripennis]|nr:hypothetical protein J6590_074005 [Homalodisca vitripennis]